MGSVERNGVRWARSTRFRRVRRAPTGSRRQKVHMARVPRTAARGPGRVRRCHLLTKTGRWTRRTPWKTRLPPHRRRRPSATAGRERTVREGRCRPPRRPRPEHHRRPPVESWMRFSPRRASCSGVAARYCAIRTSRAGCRTASSRSVRSRRSSLRPFEATSPRTCSSTARSGPARRRWSPRYARTCRSVRT